ncbi:MAG: hypothetical protein ACREJD_13640 [Phycisphaerales bacterium]
MTELAPETEAGNRSGDEPGREALREFLSTGSTHCPSCGYDVHGCDEARCPECAWPLTLQLKPRVSSVPYWIFSLLIHGWLFLWGTGGSLSIAMRAWQYHGAVSRRWVSAVNAAQAEAMIRQFTGSLDSGVAAPVAVTPARSTLIENLWTYFLAQNMVDQVSISLFVLSFLFGGVGLLLTPWMRRLSSRANALLMSASIVLFVATMLNYVAVYLSILLRGF